MKVVLLNPNTGIEERIENEAAWPPLGLLYIGTVLQENGHEVKIIDNARAQLPLEKVVEQIIREKPEMVGISALTPSFRQALKFAYAIKEKDPTIKIVFGNYHSTFMWEKLLRYCPAVDYVVLGEGEFTLLELARAIEKAGEVRDVRGVAFRHNGGVILTQPRPPIKDLDGIPFPDRGLLEQEYRSEVVGIIGSGCKFATVLSSRGCPYGCRYCACASFTARTVRFRSPENVVEEMEILWSEGYEEVGFVDDNLLLNQKRVEKICEMLRTRGIRFNIWAEGRTDQASLNILKKFSRAGCKTIYYGIESGTQKVLDYFNKNITPEISRRAVKNSKKAGIENIIGSFIVGAPIEAEEDVRRTFDFALSLREMDFPQMNILSISPGTDLWNAAVRDGYLNEEKYWDTSLSAVNVYPSHLTEGDLVRMVDRFYREYIRRPSFLALQLLKTIKSRYRLRILLANLEAGTSLRSAVGQLWGQSRCG